MKHDKPKHDKSMNFILFACYSNLQKDCVCFSSKLTNSSNRLTIFLLHKVMQWWKNVLLPLNVKLKI